jgi:hypothetical protein
MGRCPRVGVAGTVVVTAEPGFHVALDVGEVLLRWLGALQALSSGRSLPLMQGPVEPAGWFRGGFSVEDGPSLGGPGGIDAVASGIQT